MNRKEYYSSTDRDNTQYKISIIEVAKDTPKKPLKNMSEEESENTQERKITSKYEKDGIKEVNFAKKITQKKAKDFLCSHILSISLVSNKYKKFSKENTRQADFIFLDFEEDKKNSHLVLLTYEKCLEILKKNKLNYILKTSSNHTDEKPRLHLFLSTLKPIKDDATYKINRSEVLHKYFSEYAIDTSTSNIARVTYSSQSNNLEFSYNFNDNDIEVEEIDDELKARISKRNDGTKKVPLEKSSLNDFNKQVSYMHGFQFSRYDIQNGAIKYYRNNNDGQSNLWYSINYYDNSNNNYRDYVGNYTINDAKGKYNVLFTYEDYLNAIEPKKERTSIQKNLSSSMSDWFQDGGKKYVVTNEGLGKSSTILEFGKEHNFLFLCHTKLRIEEVAVSLKEKDISYKIIYSNYDILGGFGLKSLASKYDKKVRKNKKLTFKKFINDNKKHIELSDVKIEDILNAYDTNIQNLQNTNTIRIATTHKFKFEVKKQNHKGKEANNWFNDHHIIFDEFSFSDWSSYRAVEDGDEVISKKTIWNQDAYISMAENEYCLLELLESCKNLLILTTERNLIQPLFYKSDFSEMRILNYIKHNGYKGGIKEDKLEQKLYDDNLIYYVVKSTRVKIRAELIEAVKKGFMQEYNEELFVISDNVDNSDASHIKVKGSNDYSDKHTLVVGTLRTEIEDNLFYYSCPKFFDKYEEHMKSKGLKVKNEILNFVVKAHLESQVSQSIGRNSGFRDKGKKTAVVLPLLTENRKKQFKPFNLNYITPYVQIYLNAETDKSVIN